MPSTALLDLDAVATRRVAQSTSASKRSGRSKKTVLLWTVQTVLALLFLFAGGMKLVMPADALAAQSHLPGAFMKFIGLAETLGAIGLIAPGLARIATGLTPIAASGLVIIMIGATTVTIAQGMGGAAIVPAVVGVLCAVVVRYRWERRSPLTSSYQQPLAISRLPETRFPGRPYS